MDSVTHLVAGALTAAAFRKTPKRAAAITFGIVVGELPDIDVLFGSSVEAMLTLHRGITHGLLVQPVFVLIAVLPFFIWMHSRLRAPAQTCSPAQARFSPQPQRAFLGGMAFGDMWLLALAGVLLHIYLDCMTTFGTMALLPLSDERIWQPAMFIVDLLLTLPATAFLIAALREAPNLAPAFPEAAPQELAPFFSMRARRFALCGLVWLVCYPLFGLGINAYVSRAQDEAAARMMQASVPTIVLTEPFSPFFWKSVIDTGDAYAIATVTLADAGSLGKRAIYKKADAALYASLAEQHPVFAHFAAFGALMVERSHGLPAHVAAQYGSRSVTEYTFLDVRYIMSPESPARWVGRNDANFALEARVAQGGELLAYRFLNRESDAADAPWNTAQ